MEWYLKCLQQYTDFSGRARRKEYWLFAVFNFVFSLAFSLVDKLIGFSGEDGFSLLSFFYSLAVLIPSIAVSIRRLHDIGRSGKWLFIVFVPIIGVIILLVWSCQEGEQSDNQWGENPKKTNNTSPNPVYSNNTASNESIKKSTHFNLPQQGKVELPLDRLKRLCNPINFMDNYDKEKVSIANQLYSQLMDTDPDIETISLQAEKLLNVQLIDDIQIEDMKRKLNPINFMTPYDPVKVARANELYSKLVDNITYFEFKELEKEAKQLLEGWATNKIEKYNKESKLETSLDEDSQQLNKQAIETKQEPVDENFEHIAIIISIIASIIIIGIMFKR